MRIIFHTIARLLLFGVMVIGLRASAQREGSPVDPLVSSFSVTDVPASQALLQLSKNEHFPLGIIVQGDALCRTKVSYSAESSHASAIASAIASQVAGYAVTSRAGSLVIVGPASPSASTSQFLSLIDPRYTVKGNLQTIATMLWVHILALLHPEQGSAGSILGSPSDRLFSVELRNVSIEQILDRIATETRGVWVLRPLPAELRQLGADAPFNVFSEFGQYGPSSDNLCAPSGEIGY